MLPDRPLSFYLACVSLVLLPIAGFAQCWPLSEKLNPTKSFDTQEGLGTSMDIEGNIAVVSAPQSDTMRVSSGVVYVFEFDDGEWKKIASLTTSDHNQYKNFGQKVLIDGDQILVGDPYRDFNRGGVYIYNKPAGGWRDMVESSLIVADHPLSLNFGSAMSIYQNTLLVGAPGTSGAAGLEGGAFVFKKQGNTWVQIATLKSPERKRSPFGYNVALRKNIAVVVASEEPYPQGFGGIGSTYVFEKADGSEWTDMYPVGKLKESSGNESIAYLGNGLEIDESRNTVFVTQYVWGPLRGYKAIEVYKKPASGWTTMTETYRYLDSTQSNVFPETLIYQEPYLYSGGGALVNIFTPDNDGNWTVKQPFAKLSNTEFSRQQQFGQGLAVGDDHILVGAPARVTHDRDTLIAPLTPSIFVFDVSPMGWSAGTHMESASFTYMPVTATDYFFGFDVAMDGDVAVVGSPVDNIVGTRAGALYVYQLQNYKWNKVATLVQSDGEPFDNFGRSVAISGDYIVAGAEYKDYRNGSGKILDHTLGAVYVFKKPVGGWTNASETFKVVRSDGFVDYTDRDRDDDHFGTAVALDFPYLLVSRFDNGSRPNSGSVSVYNLTGDQAVLEATLTPSYRDAVNNFGEFLSVSDSTIAIACGTTGFWFGERNNVFMYERKGERWRDATESGILVPSDNGSTGYLPGIAFGQSIDMTEDGSQVIVGAPAWFDGIIFQTTDYFKGAAYIYERPADGWKGTLTEQAHLTIPGQVPYANMGVSVRIEDRYAVVGSPQNYWYTNGSQNPGPGRTYFYQKPDDGWKYKLPDKILHGDDWNSGATDYFGASVDGVFGYLMISAIGEDVENDIDAGAVYIYTEYPFINPTPSPICENAGPVQLTAVPSGGVWQGSGLINPNDGIFYPSTAGVGNHKIRYKVDDCEASNTLLIRVKEVPKQQTIFENDSLYFCGALTKHLETQPRRGFTYSWSFSEQGSSYVPVGSSVPYFDANKTGHYRLTVANECASATDTVWVGDLSPDAGPDFSLCATNGMLQLSGNYASGMWSGPGVSPNGLFDAAITGAGVHELYYDVIPTSGCIYRDTTRAMVFSMPTIDLQVSGAETFCYTGKATLSATAAPNIDYDWYYGTDINSFTTINNNDSQLIAEEFGFYKLIASDGLCSKQMMYNLIVPLFKPKLTPEFDSIAFCADQPIDFTAESIPGAEYSWMNYGIDPPEQIRQASGAFSEIIKQSGKFRLTIDSHGCHFESGDMVAWKIPGDSLYVPNIFTPNGDDRNELFEVYTEGVKEYTISVFNRYGQQLWYGTEGNAPWDAANTPVGVYYWVISYVSQCSGPRQVKGWVQVLK